MWAASPLGVGGGASAEFTKFVTSMWVAELDKYAGCCCESCMPKVNE